MEFKHVDPVDHTWVESKQPPADHESNGFSGSQNNPSDIGRYTACEIIETNMVSSRFPSSRDLTIQFSSIPIFLVLAAGYVYDPLPTFSYLKHICVTNRVTQPVGGTPFSPSYTWSNNYEILPAESKCACDYYRQRGTGDKQWDSCPDCTFDGTYCNSAGWHIGGDEVSDPLDDLLL
ncbi:hypothetical protein V1506DRAFT_524900 [Lipomyces tetrasporus]